MVESLSFGVPVIVSRDSALSEVAGAAGYAVDPMSKSSICDALSAVTTGKEDYRALQSKALTQCENFSWERSAAAMYALLHGAP